MSSFSIFSDGACRGNPGPSGVGVVIKNPQGSLLKEVSLYIGNSTNNAAEYMALIIGLIEALKLNIKNASVFMDSELLVRQITGKYKIKGENLKPLFFQVKYLCTHFDEINFNHIPREQNQDADRLAYEATKQALL
ncbi:MAG TPA: ribonuclease HI family protein [Candidatus Omnitrophica bacterium]|nr:ribonuclease HI family protein [Candidatus Omnitrophota bacterium]